MGNDQRETNTKIQTLEEKTKLIFLSAIAHEIITMNCSSINVLPEK